MVFVFLLQAEETVTLSFRLPHHRRAWSFRFYFLFRHSPQLTGAQETVQIKYGDQNRQNNDNITNTQAVIPFQGQNPDIEPFLTIITVIPHQPTTVELPTNEFCASAAHAGR
jgi:hypothetical protein